MYWYKESNSSISRDTREISPEIVKKYTQFVYKIDFNYDIFLNYNIFVSTVRTFHTSFFDLLRIISLSTK